MKNRPLILVNLLILALLTLLPAHAVQAAPLPQTSPSEQIVTFADLGYAQDIVLQGPFGSKTLSFSLPPEWKLQPGAELELNLSAYFSTFVIGQEEQNLDTINAGQLEITFNGIALTSAILQGRGEKSLLLTLPDEALQPVPGSDLHTLEVQWNAGATCEINLATSIVLHPASRLILPYTLAAPSPALSRYPWPLIQTTASFNKEATLVLPDRPKAGELEAALAIAVQLGHDSAGKLAVTLLPESQLDAARKQNSNLILIGRTPALKTLEEIDLPQAPQEMTAEDGLLRMAASPWNETLQVIAVGGQSEAAVLKAGRALSAGSLLPSSVQDNTAVVSEMTIPAAAQTFSPDQTFADLKEDALTFTEFGSTSQTIFFDLPYGMQIGADAYLDLAFNHSQLLDYLRSGIIVRLNGEPVGSVRLSDATADYNRLRIILPASSLITGSNELQFQVDLQPRTICLDPRQESLWVTIFEESLLHLPPTGQSAAEAGPLTVGDFPAALLNQEPANIHIIVSEAAPAAWQAAGVLAFHLGAGGCGCQNGPQVRFDSKLTSEEMENASLILIGQPSQLPVLDNLSTLLPVSFDSGNQLSAEDQSRIAFRTEAGSSLGYLQAAWLDAAQHRVAFTILGSDDTGLLLAVDSLANPQLKDGNFVLLQGSQMIVRDIQPGQVSPEMIIPAGEELQQQTPAPAGEIPAVPSTQAFAPWILPAMIFSSIAVILLVIWEIIHNQREKE